MNDHPLLFTTENVIRILTCARCGKISVEFPCCHCGSTEFCKTQTRRVPVERYRNWKVGDTLWVKEGFQIHASSLSLGMVCGNYLVDRSHRFKTVLSDREYRLFNDRKFPNRKTPGRFMYKSLARIILEITGLRHERVQDISWRDCKAEGLTLIGDELVFNSRKQKHSLLRTKFNRLWGSINSKRHNGIYAWRKNPAVKVIEFKRIKNG